MKNQNRHLFPPSLRMDWRSSLLKISIFLKINNPGVDSSSTGQSRQVPGQPSLCHAGMSPGLVSHSSRHIGCRKFSSYWRWIKWKQNSLQSLSRDVLTYSKGSICAHFSKQFCIKQPGHRWCEPNMPNKRCRWWFSSAEEPFVLLQENHRIVKVGKRPLRSSSPITNTALPGPTLNNAPRCYMYGCFLNISRNGGFTTSLGSVFHCLITLLMKKFFPVSNLTFPWQNLRPTISACSVQGQH